LARDPYRGEKLTRYDGRLCEQLRPTRISFDVQRFAEGSVLIETGDTKIICSVSIEERVPSWLKGQGKGWITAEYSMLPRSTFTRNVREASSGKVKGRHQEIQRLIGRALRSSADLVAVGERTILIDCDVIQADGGTRTAAITGSYVALYQALHKLTQKRIYNKIPLNFNVAAVSVGVLEKELLLDLSYEEDFRASVDFNIAMTEKGDLIEIQASGEDGPFEQVFLQRAVVLGQKGILELIRIQNQAIESLSSQKRVSM